MRRRLFPAALVLLALLIPASAQQTLTCTANAGVPPIIRAESITELVGDVVLNCTGGTPTPVGLTIPLSNITVSLNTNITSRIVGPASSASEALLLIDDPFPGNAYPPGLVPSPGSPPQGYCAVNGATFSLSACGIVATGGGGGVNGPYKTTNIFQGQQVSANSVAWLGLRLDPPGDTLVRSLRITNIRADAGQLGVTSTLIPTQVVMFIQISGAPPVTVPNPQQSVAFIVPGLAVGGTSKVELQCNSLNNTLVGSSSNTTTDGPAFVTAQEGFASSFKARGYAVPLPNIIGTSSPTLQNVPGFPYNTESGLVSTVTGGATTGQIGVADYGTRIMFTFSGAGNGLSLFVPNFIPLVLAGSCATNFLSGCISSGGLAVLVSATDANGNGGSLFSGATNLSPQLCTSATGLCGADLTAVTNNTVVYEVVQTNPNALEQLVVPVSPAYISGINQPGLGQITVTMQFAPQSTVATSSSSAPVPRFLPGPARNFISIISCFTSPAILSIQKVHSGSFPPGQQNSAYLVTVTNANGAGPTNGTVTVIENLPSGLQLVSMSGSGWTCSGASCSRDDSLNGGAGYPPITVLVNVAANAVSPQVNAVSVSGGGSAPAGTTDTTVIVPGGAPVGLQFVPVTPCRVIDTRNANGAFGGPFLAGGSTRAVPIQSSPCGIPASAQAYSLNTTVVPRTSTLGYLTVWPAGQAQPAVSTLNSPDGSVLANATIVPAGAGGVDVFATNDTDLLIDINGYFTPPVPNSLQFYPLLPCRLLDTRHVAGSYVAGVRFISVFPNSCGIPASAQVYSFNVTVVPREPLGYLTLWPSGQTQPNVSTLNSLDGTVLANAAITPAGIFGDVRLYASNATDLVIDVNGYFAPPGPGGLNFYPVTPCRVADTRGPNGPIIPGGSTRTFPLPLSTCGLPASSAAYSLNMTVVPQGPLGFLTAWPTGQTQPVVSTLNALKGIVIANAALVPAGTGGSINVFVSNTTHVIIDANGYFQ